MPFTKRARVSVDDTISGLGRNYAKAPHCDVCGFEPRQQANYGLMLAQLRIHKQNQHGQKRGQSKRMQPEFESAI